jgi:uncharacterized membrane protein AbrB (regulator of aidB expression)
MTLVDRCIPFYVWFLIGFGIISMIMGIVNFGMIGLTLLTVKGISVPSFVIVIITLLVVLFCISIGYTFQRYSILDRITNYQNDKYNPQVRLILSELSEIKKKLDEKNNK